MKKGKLIFITGGQKSGKSFFAEKYVLQISTNPVYLATAYINDDETLRRVEKHRERRGKHWTTVEAPLHLDTCIKDKTVLMDCLTMFATNHFFNSGEDILKAYEAVVTELQKLIAQEKSTLVIVSNEIGFGGISCNKMQRQFTDLQGSLNQYIADLADEAYLVVSGIPVRIK